MNRREADQRLSDLYESIGPLRTLDTWISIYLDKLAERVNEFPLLRGRNKFFLFGDNWVNIAGIEIKVRSLEDSTKWKVEGARLRQHDSVVSISRERGGKSVGVKSMADDEYTLHEAIGAMGSGLAVLDEIHQPLGEGVDCRRLGGAMVVNFESDYWDASVVCAQKEDLWGVLVKKGDASGDLFLRELTTYLVSVFGLPEGF